jgi:hypothetical protein
MLGRNRERTFWPVRESARLIAGCWGGVGGGPGGSRRRKSVRADFCGSMIGSDTPRIPPRYESPLRVRRCEIFEDEDEGRDPERRPRRIIATKVRRTPRMRPGKNPATTAAAGNLEQCEEGLESQVGLADEATFEAVDVGDDEVVDDAAADVEEDVVVDDEACLLTTHPVP